MYGISRRRSDFDFVLGRQGGVEAHYECETMPSWSWESDDEDEALGMRLVLERGGIEVRCVHTSGRVRLEVADEDEPRVQRLLTRLQGHYVRKVDAARVTSLSRRSRRGFRVLWGIGIALIGGTIALLFAS